MYIMMPELISTAHLINTSHQSVLIGNSLVESCEYTCNNRRIVGCVVFCAVRVISEGSSQLVLSRISCYYFLLSSSWNPYCISHSAGERFANFFVLPQKTVCWSHDVFRFSTILGVSWGLLYYSYSLQDNSNNLADLLSFVKDIDFRHKAFLNITEWF
jgi:hypothetical protein